MANILPEVEVRGSLQQIYLEPKARGIFNCKLPMTKVEGSMIRDIHHLTMVHIIYTYYSVWADYINWCKAGSNPTTLMVFFPSDS